MIGMKDLENKKFIVIMEGLGLAALGLLAIGLSSVLGGSTEIDINNSDEII